VTSQSCRYQRTLARPTAAVCGTGFLTGAEVRLRFLPAPPATGVLFLRTDLPGQPRIRAHIDQVTGTDRRTTLGQPPVQVGLVEHVMAALSGLRIDNCLVELNAPEPPGLDGSTGAFVRALLEAGTHLQAPRRPVWHVPRRIVVQSGGASLAIHPVPGSEFLVTYFLDYGLTSPIARQVHTQTVTPSSFATELAHCRTFLLESEALALRRLGMGSRTTPADLLIFGPHGPIQNTLRYANEPARHKVLDIIGDLALLGVDLAGHVVAYRSGHPLNAELSRLLQQEIQADRLAQRRVA
jgi:UDP-3-O-acyl N-acetylglucosamine deacetylase